MILTDLKECDYEQEKQGEKEKNSWRSYSDDRSDRGNLYFSVMQLLTFIIFIQNIKKEPMNITAFPKWQ